MPAELHQSESTVLFHIERCAIQGSQPSRHLATCLTQLTHCPEILFGNSTFLLSSALMICKVQYLRDKVRADVDEPLILTLDFKIFST